MMNAIQKYRMYHVIKRHGAPDAVRTCQNGDIILQFFSYFVTIDPSGNTYA